MLTKIRPTETRDRRDSHPHILSVMPLPFDSDVLGLSVARLDGVTCIKDVVSVLSGARQGGVYLVYVSMDTDTGLAPGCTVYAAPVSVTVRLHRSVYEAAQSKKDGKAADQRRRAWQRKVGTRTGSCMTPNDRAERDARLQIRTLLSILLLIAS